MQILKPKLGYKLVKSLFGRFEEIPEDWSRKTLKEIGELSAGGTPSTFNKVYWYDGTIPWVSSGEVKNNRIHISEKKITESGLKNSAAKLFPPGTVLVALTGFGMTRGRSSILEIDATTNQSVIGIITKDDLANNEFVWHALQKQYQILRNFAQGTQQPGLNLDILEKFRIILPDNVTEQQKIAAILSNVDSLIHQTQKEIKQTQKLKKGLVLQLLRKGIGHKKFKDSEIGKIPESWEAKPLEKVLTIIQYGLSKPLSAVGKYPIFRMNSIQKGEVLERDMKFIDLEYDEFKKYKLEKNDLLFNRTNSYELVGKIGIFLLEGDYTFAGYLIRLRTNEKMNPVFLNNYLNTKQSQYRVKRFATPGVSQTNINATNLKSVIIPAPPREEQDKIATILDKFDFSIIELKSKKKILDELKKGLMQKLLTGQIRV